MSVTFTVKISDALSTNMNGMNNIIKQVKFSITGTDGDNTVTNFFPVNLDYPDPKNFIAYENLTKDQIEQWVMAKVGESYITTLKNGITAQLEEKATEDPDNPILQRIELPS